MRRLIGDNYKDKLKDKREKIKRLNTVGLGIVEIKQHLYSFEKSLEVSPALKASGQ